MLIASVLYPAVGISFEAVWRMTPDAAFERFWALRLARTPQQPTVPFPDHSMGVC